MITHSTDALTFVIPDLHGRPEMLRSLLRSVGLIDAFGQRIDPGISVVSIGDLCNGVLKSIDGDEQSLLLAQDWIDLFILGNHEAGYLFPNLGFNGFVSSPPLQSLYRSLHRKGKIVPAVLIGETLLTHAGVQEYYAFKDAVEAYENIMDVWDRYEELRNDWDQKFDFDDGKTQIPKALLLDGISAARGGSAPMGGILWSDWRKETKNTNFSQVVGHTPIAIGPVLHTYGIDEDIFHLNIDCGAKSDLSPVGVWLDARGRIVEFVTI
jgi:Calcineurin-like phosphoesterase